MQLSERLNINSDGSHSSHSSDGSNSSEEIQLRFRWLLRVRWVPAIVVLVAMVTQGRNLHAPWRLVLASVVLYGAFKFAAAVKQWALWPTISVEAWFWYLTVWPGMDLRRFRIVPERAPVNADLRWLMRGIGGMALGVGILGGAVLADVGPALGGWLAIAGLLALVHFGWADVLSWMLRRRGFEVRRLFNTPERASSLNDFWTRRWNIAFVEMDQVLFMPRLRRMTGHWAPVLMLLGSGVMHELAISYPAGSGWGLPLLYFAIHGAGMQLERTGWFRARSPRFAQWWTRLLVLAPVGLVFHRPFRDALPLEFLLLLKDLKG